MNNATQPTPIYKNKFQNVGMDGSQLMDLTHTTRYK